jgi:PhoPQ-activated pathogenicity-related protein
MTRHSMPIAALLLLAGLPGACSREAPAPTTPATIRAVETSLDRYVAEPDPAFSWRVSRELPAEGVRATLLEMTSQRWLTEQEVEQPLWTHWVSVAHPETLRSDVALLFISGGRHDRSAPGSVPGWLAAIARDTGTVAAELRLVPNQPIVFQDDPARKPRFEDDFIAYTWDRFLRTGDDRWPARLPMTKSAVRAMDAISEFVASPAGGRQQVSRFVVAGASKRGWTAWTTAAVDRRVIALAPAVIDMLNVEPSFVHHYRAYGDWSDAVQDYVDHGIMHWMGTPEFRALMEIEEPYEYRERLTMPKLLLNATGDQFFLPDSSQFYIDDLEGETHLRYVPNTSHGLEKSDALETLHAFYAAVVSETPRPQVDWRFEDDGAIRVTATDRPSEVLLWQATNPKARNFRLDVLGPAFRSTALTPEGPNTWVGRVNPPAAGWTAYFIELTFPGGGSRPLKVTTGVKVTPDTLPFEAPRPGRPAAAAAHVR